MFFGVDYYPEHWDKTEWKEHAKLMKKGNFNIARIAEFAWCRLEPEENRFDFSWLDEAIETLASENIKVILGTPTAAPPKWLVNKYDIFMRDKYGRIRGYGSRRECCANNPHYIERSGIIVKKLAEHYGNHPNVSVWQIDNEFGCHTSTICYCEHCKKKFADWLKNKYADIDELNKRYGTVFWSHEYSDFNDVIIPAYTSCEGTYGDRSSHNPSLEMDFHRFSSDSWVEYEKMQADIIKNYSEAPITHNFMGHFSGIDYYKLGEPLDFISWDNYIDNQWNNSEYEKVSMAHELMRGVKNKNFWVMEEQSGPCGWDKFGGTPRPNQLRLWSYQAIAHGCEGMLYFRFKSVPFGMEQYWLGVVDHDGIPRRRFDEISKTGAEFKKLSQIFEGAESITDVLIVKSYEEVWGHQIKSHTKMFDYRDLLYSYYKANNHIGTNPACGGENMIGNKYKIIYMPAYSMPGENIKLRLEEYVSSGGTLVLTYRSGFKNKDNNIVTETIPGKLKELTGITVEEFDSSPVKTKLSSEYGTAEVWRDIVKCETAVPVINYESEFYEGTPAVTVNQFGKGRVYYVACDLCDEALVKLITEITAAAGAEYIPHPEGTEAVRRIKNGKEYLMLLNYTNKTNKTDFSGVSLINGCRFDGTLNPYGVEIIEYL